MRFLVTVSGVDGDVHPDHVREALEVQAQALVDLVDAAQVTVELAGEATELPDGEVRVFEPDPENADAGRMYVLDVFGFSVLIRERAGDELAGGDVYVHVDRDGSSAPIGQRNLVVEVENGGEMDYPSATAESDG